MPKYPVGQAFRLLQKLQPLDITLPPIQPGYLIYQHETECRGEDGQRFPADAGEDTRWFWPVTKKTIQKLGL